MSRRVEFIFDVVSPNAYLAWFPLKDVIARTNAALDVTPVFLGGMHRLTGNAPPMVRDREVKGKVEYSMLEFNRFIRRHRLDRFKMHPQFPFNSVDLQRMLLAVDGAGRVRLAEAFLVAVWENQIDISDPGAAVAVADDLGLDGAALAAATQDEAIKQQLIDNTADAVDRGAFGIPTYFVDGEMYFGKERLGQIEEALSAVG